MQRTSNHRGPLWALVLCLLGALTAVGCGAKTAGDETAGGNGGTCVGSVGALSVTPQVLRRGEAVDIQVAWDLGFSPRTPVLATLETGGADRIEVELDLAEVQPGLWTAAIINPFGVGVAAGEVAVLAETPKEGCGGVPLRAVASFLLAE